MNRLCNLLPASLLALAALAACKKEVDTNFAYPVGNAVNPAALAQTDPKLRYPRRLPPGATEVLYSPNAIAKLFSDVGVPNGDNNTYITKPLWFDQP